MGLVPGLAFLAEEVRLVEVRRVARSGVAGTDADEVRGVFGSAVLGGISWLEKSFAGSKESLIVGPALILL